jgi:hypothetical protein
MDNISLVETNDIDKKIQKILRQTDFSEDDAREKLKENNFDELKVIKNYFGITEKQHPPIKSINQEIYKQLRNRLDTSMRDYRTRVEKNDKNTL